MQQERVAEDIYVFTSELYAQVTAGVVLTSEGAIVIDTMVFPEETLALRRFVENRLRSSVRYVINTHYHADHTTGTCFFPEAQVIAHQQCRQLLDTRGRESIERLKASSEEMHDITLILPHIVFDCGEFTLQLGDKTIQLWQAPGHSPDGIACLVQEDRILFAGDAMMPLPHFVDGDYDVLYATLHSLKNGNYENVVQGHGEVILRGEIEEKIDSDLNYLQSLSDAVNAAIASTNSDTLTEALAEINIEACGKSRILLTGSAQQLHRQNVQALAKKRLTN